MTPLHLGCLQVELGRVILSHLQSTLRRLSIQVEVQVRHLTNLALACQALLQVILAKFVHELNGEEGSALSYVVPDGERIEGAARHSSLPSQHGLGDSVHESLPGRLGLRGVFDHAQELVYFLDSLDLLHQEVLSHLRKLGQVPPLVKERLSFLLKVDPAPVVVHLGEE